MLKESGTQYEKDFLQYLTNSNPARQEHFLAPKVTD